MTPRSGQVAIVTIALVGLVFFGGMELIKRQLHAPTAALSNVVVLPSKVVGPDDMDYLADAVPASLSTLLTRVPGLESVRRDRQMISDPGHVTATLTSEITVEEDALTLNIQLVNPETHSLLWNSQYKSKRTDYNGLILQAANGAGHALQPAASKLTSSAGLAATSDAELAYREGEYYSTRSDCARATAAFKRARQLDPGLVAPRPAQGGCSLP